MYPPGPAAHAVPGVICLEGFYDSRNGNCNDDDRRQWRKQGGVVGAAASKTQVPPKARCGCWVPQPDGGGHSKSSHIKRLLHKTLCSSLKYFAFTTDQMLNCTAQKAA